MKDKVFWDSNLWIYLFAESQNPVDVRKKLQLTTLLQQPSYHIVSSAQVLNEVGNALMRKYKCNELQTKIYLQQILLLTDNQPLSSEITLQALYIKNRYQLGWYDSIIVTSSLLSGCKIFYSEDMNDGLAIENTLTIKNPFLL